MPIDNIDNFKDNNQGLKIPNEVLPMIPMRAMMLFPGMLTHIDIARDTSAKALEIALKINKNKLFLLAQRRLDVDFPKVADLFTVGTIAVVKNVIKLPGGGNRVIVEGLARAYLREFIDKESYLEAIVEPVAVIPNDSLELIGAARMLSERFMEYADYSKKIAPEAIMTVRELTEPGAITDFIMGQINVKFEVRQKILETIDIKARVYLALQIISSEIEILKVQSEIEAKVKASMDKNQREYFLREEEKAIKNELHEKDDKDIEASEYMDKLRECGIPEPSLSNVLKEAERLTKMAPIGPEATVVRSYLDWILEIPWSAMSVDNKDINEAEKILNEDHFGLEKPKERILEYLAVANMTNELKGPILCLVGPPGVGKTSLAKSIARATGREYVRVSLGGIRDEAEIRGHRKTYIGAMPGRIIQGLKKAKTKNPVFLLDEVDKMSMDFRGDPSSALLEVLDPEQNKGFSDHYIEEPVDLSKVLFIVTANLASNIPRPLMDRMEVIELPGYTQEEKLCIATNYLVPKQLLENGLTKDNVSIPEESLKIVIDKYVREAGIRNLEREIGKICRKACLEISKNHVSSIFVDDAKIKEYLGSYKYSHDELEDEDTVGSALGLAWTEVGGEILHIETNVMDGKGELILTGKLGEVMQESAKAAYSYIRAHRKDLGIEEDFHEKKDIHIHVPEGATPKDGPSAGITMATSMISALTNKPVRHDLAMTGEITIRGHVLPIGGVKEKTLAARRAGCKTVILPFKNQKDLEEIPEELKASVEFVFVKELSDVLKVAIGDL